VHPHESGAASIVCLSPTLQQFALRGCWTGSVDGFGTRVSAVCELTQCCINCRNIYDVWHTCVTRSDELPPPPAAREEIAPGADYTGNF